MPFVSVSKASRGKDDSTAFWRYFLLLIKEVGVTAFFNVVQKIHKQKDPVKRFAFRFPRMNLGMPMMATAGTLVVFLNVHQAGPIKSERYAS